MVAFGFITRRAAASQRPGERVVFGEVGELVPVVVDRVDHALVGPRERPFELEIVGRIGEDEVDRGRRQPFHLGDAVADQDHVARRGTDCGRACRLAGASTHNLNLGGETRRSGTQGTHQRNHSTQRPARSNRRVVYGADLSKGPVMRRRLTLCRFRTSAPAKGERDLNAFETFFGFRLVLARGGTSGGDRGRGRGA